MLAVEPLPVEPAARPARSAKSDRRHLLAALDRIDLLLRLEIARRQSDPAAAQVNEFRGLYVSEEEIRRLCGEGLERGIERETRPVSDLEPLLSALAAAEDRLEAASATALERGVLPPLAALAERCGLTSFDVDALLLCLAPEIDSRYEKLYAYLQDDVTRKRPTAGLVLALLCASREERIEKRARLTAGAPLLRWGLLAWAAGDEEAPFPARALEVDDRIVHFLLELDVFDELLVPFASVRAPRCAIGELALPADLREGLVRLVSTQITAARAGETEAPRFVLQGRPGMDRELVAEALCAEAGAGLLLVDVPRLLASGPIAGQLAARAFREAALFSLAVFLDGAEALLDDEAAGHGGRQVLDAMAGFDGLVFLGTERAWPPRLAGGAAFCRVELPAPEASTRRALWHSLAARESTSLAPDVDLDGFAERFAFDAGKIRRALAEAGHLAAMAGGGAVTAAHLGRTCRAQHDDGLSHLARKIAPVYAWDDIVLPADRLDQLREICAHVRHQRQVFERWEFDRKVARGRGVSALFAGPSGAGKTMAAEVVAGEVGLDLYKIDLACVVSKYIGETEKNLARVFREAEESRAVLFFDEADALFGKRSQVRDAHDRYANIEIDYLLQRMEEHEGVVILASNFRKNIDEAFTRRLRFIVELPLPDEGLRRRLWSKLLPDAVPLRAGVDLDFLARQFKVAGGSIRNIALGAAFLAAADGGVVSMEHLLRATRREVQKSGQLCVAADFGPYVDLVGEVAG